MDFSNKLLIAAVGTYAFGLCLFGGSSYIAKSILPLMMLKNFISMKIRGKVLSWLNAGLAIDRSTHLEVNYFLGDRWYSIAIPKNRNRQIASIFSPHSFSRENEEDVKIDIDITQKIESYLGPHRNFHGVATTPKMLGYNNLIVEYKNGVRKSFESSDVISLTS
jgi:hypothetical protein